MLDQISKNDHALSWRSGVLWVSKLLEISMKLLKSSLLGSAAAFAAVAGAQAADLPVKKAAPIEYV
ncbi:hypothetical protein, partial [Methylobacterium gregans]|uniref:hypothetical protein n=1 Tax=Methylobacterium gregans TaxID=374424 RepID=UPI003D66F0F0